MTWPGIVALTLIAICLVPRGPLPLLYLSFIGYHTYLNS
jgi:hypothetical protein